jgi:hypothetical protein
MTIEQKKQLEIYRKQYQQNCSQNAEFGSSRICNFHVYETRNDDDKNITIVMTTITDISDNYQPFIGTTNIMIEPDGNPINLADVFPKSQVSAYVEQLKIIDNG